MSMRRLGIILFIGSILALAFALVQSKPGLADYSSRATSVLGEGADDRPCPETPALCHFHCNDEHFDRVKKQPNFDGPEAGPIWEWLELRPKSFCLVTQPRPPNA